MLDLTNAGQRIATTRQAGPGSSPLAPRPAGAVHPLLVLLLAGALLRLVLWGWFADRAIEIADEKDYNALANNLVRHGEFAIVPGSPSSLRPPLYPAVVAGVYSLFGPESFQAVRLLQVLLSLVTVLLLFGLGTEVYSRRAGLWLAGLYCFYPSMLGYNNLLLTEVLFTLLLVGCCYAVVLFYKRGALLYALLAGVLLGLAALTRSIVWLSPPFLAGYLVLTWKAPLRRRLLASAALVLAFSATITPWAVRNTRLQQTFVAIDVMGGRNVLMGNYRYTPLYRSWAAISIEGERGWVHEVISTYPPEQHRTQGQLDKLALHRGLQFVRENPGLTLKRDVIKFFDFWGLERELVAGAGRGYFGALSAPLIFALAVLICGSYVAALFLGIFGAVLAAPADRRLHWFFLLVIAFVCGLHTLAFGHSRYHLPLMPFVLLYAAGALLNVGAVWQQRRSWRFWLAAGLCAVLVMGWAWSAAAGDWERYRSALRPLL